MSVQNVSSSTSSYGSAPTSISTATSSDSSSSLGQGIISSIGVGSGLDVTSILSQLQAADSVPLTTLQNQASSYNTQLSAYGTLSSALSTFQNSLIPLSSESTFDTLNATSSNSAVVTASVGSTANTGNYTLNVSQLAQAQTISTPGQASETNSIGTGATTTLTFTFGSVSGSATNGTYGSGTTFTADPTQSVGTVTINSSNNSLEGIESAINAANIGVQASIVGDGSSTPYHLVLTSTNSGATSNMQIGVNGDSSLQNLLSYNPAGTQNLTQITAGQSATATINGIAVTSTSNTISNSISGASFTLTGTGTATVNVAANTSGVTSDINSFVSAYNTLQTSISSLTSYNSTNPSASGPLLGNPTIAALQSQLASIFNGEVNGLSGASSGLTNLSQIGIGLQTNGTLAVNSTQLQAALTSNFQGVSALFSSTGNTSDSLTSFVTATGNTQPGTYGVNVTSMATGGLFVGDTNLNSAPTTISANTSINVTVDGTSAAVQLTAGTYSATQLAALIESSINNNSTFSSNDLGVTTSIDANGNLNILSNSFGTSSGISLAGVTGTPVSSLIGTAPTSNAGTNVIGTIDGQPATGSGQFLTGATGTPVAGLEIQISGGSTGTRGTISYSSGYAYQMNNLINSYITPSTGVLANATAGINTELTSLQTQETNMQSQINAQQAAYQAEFSALDTVMSGLNSTQSFITSELGVLNGTTNSSS